MREFVSLAGTQSYFETAERMYVTTSSLSRHIVKLEEDLGAALFDRTTRKVSLTRYGELFLPYARELIRIDDERAAAFDLARRRERETLTVGSIPMMKAYGITELLAAFQKAHPEAVLELREGDSYALAPMLRSGECDLAFLRDIEGADEEFERIPFARDRLCAIVPAGHPLAREKAVPLARLQNEALLMIGKDAFMYKLCTDVCRAAGFAPKVVFTSRRGENLIELVGRGVGVAMLMRRAAEGMLTDGVRRVDIEPPVTTTVYLAKSPGRALNAYAKAFLETAARRGGE